MSQAVAARIPIGPCQVFIDDYRVGTSKSQAILTYECDLVTGRRADNVAEIAARRQNERATMQVTIADLRTSQLRYIFGWAKSLQTNSLMTSNYLASTTQEMRRWSEIQLSCTGSATGLVSLPVVYTSGTVVVYSMDYETQYVQDTDFETGSECDGICRLGAGITTNAWVNVYYNADTTCSYVRAGGADANFESTIRLVGVNAQGCFYEFKAWRAQREGPANIQINEAAEYPGQTLTYRLLADVTNYNKGSQLFQFAVQTPA